MLALALLLLTIHSAAQAAGEDARALPASLREAAPALELLGEGRLTWWGFSVYDARLYAESAALDYDRRFALELSYARDFDAADIVEVSIEEMRRLTEADETMLARWRGAMTRIFPDIREGDRLIALYDPAGAVRFYDAGGTLGIVEDAGFARAFFAIWLDPETKTAGLRHDLLGEETADDAAARHISSFSPTN